MTSEAPVVEPRERLAWVDAARALCVLAVVVMHTTISLLAVFEPDPLDMTWRHIVDAMTPFRMPALSLLSGMLLASRIRAGFGDRRALASIALSAWLYVVWLAVFLVVALTVGTSVWLGQFGYGETKDSLGSFVDQLVLPRTVLWYVLALAVWSAILAAVRQVPPAAVLIVLSALSIVSFSLPSDGAEQHPNMVRYFVFFAVGVYASGRDPRPHREGAVDDGTRRGGRVHRCELHLVVRAERTGRRRTDGSARHRRRGHRDRAGHGALPAARCRSRTRLGRPAHPADLRDARDSARPARDALGTGGARSSPIASRAQLLR